MLITSRPARSAAMPVLFLLSGPKNRFFAPQGPNVDPINEKFCVRERTKGPLYNAKFHVYRGRNVGILSVWEYPKLSVCREATDLGHPHPRLIL